MKKFPLLAALFLGLTALCFARGGGDLEVFGGAPVILERGELLGEDATTRITSLSLGYAWMSPINERVALGFHNEIIFPLWLELSVDGETTSLTRSDYNLLVGMSFLFGPVFHLYSGDRISVPLTAGIRWMWLAATTSSVSIFGNNFGLGAGIGTNFNIGERTYIFGRMMMYYDFFSLSTMEVTTWLGRFSRTSSGFINSFGIAPHIGVGFTF